MSEKEGKIKIIDLDAFVPEDREVVINKITYKVKGDASVKTTLKLLKSAEVWQKSPASPESIDALITSIQAFFITPISKEVLENLDVSDQLPKLVAFLYGQELKDDKGKNVGSQPETK